MSRLNSFAQACAAHRAELARVALVTNNWKKQNRPETGAMKFGDDWTGVFIRGDNAAFYAYKLGELLEQAAGWSSLGAIDLAQLQGLANLLGSSLEGSTSKYQALQVLKPFKECKA